VRDLSLHILDLIENSLRASATTVAVGLCADARRDVLRLVIEDNGPGLPVAAHEATDPFFTTKNGKRIGLGLSLFKATAERAGGTLELRKSGLGGLAVEARMQLSHVDRCPLGDLAATLCSIVCMNPRLDLRLDLDCGDRRIRLNVQDVAREMAAGVAANAAATAPGGAEAWHPLVDGLALANRVGELLRDKLPQDGSHSVLA
jgi:anti-sigma regulatory factor (Ser/Thr protein kinase)